MGRKICLATFIISLIFLIGLTNVSAKKVEGPLKDWGTDKAVRLCKYGSGAPTVEIVYNTKNNGYGIYYKHHKSDSWEKIDAPTSYKGLFDHKKVVSNKEDVAIYDVGWLEKGESEPSKAFTSYRKESDFTACPSVAYLSKFNDYVYFSLEKETNKKGLVSVFLLDTKKEEYKDKFEVVINYLNGLSNEELIKIASDGLKVGSVQDSGIKGFVDMTGVTTRLPQSTLANGIFIHVAKKFFHSGEMPEGLKFRINSWITEKYKNGELKQEFDEAVNQEHEDGMINDENYNNYVQNSDNLWANNQLAVSEHPINEDTSYGNNVHDPVTDINCRSILTEDLTILVKNVINFIRFLGPLLVIVFTIIEFAGSIFSADVSITKPLGRFVRRLIAAAILFFLPFLIFPLFDFLHITMAEECFSILN